MESSLDTSCRRIAPGSTRCYRSCVDTHPEITQRDLRTRSREIMDAVEHGQSFTVTRDGHRIAELIPLRQRRRFVTRQEFAAMSRNAPAVDLEAFRADQDAALDHQTGSAYER
jgi:prevent-host-death family protein